jgi:multiple sugar transport system substrate-binding protein
VAYRDLQPVTGSNKAFRFDVTTVPGETSVLGGQNLAVTRGSDQPRAAQALIEFLTGERSQQILFEHGGFAATREIVYRDANITTKYPYATTLLTAIRRARARPETPHYTDFSREFRKVVMEVWQNDGEITADHARRLADALEGKRGG